MDLRRVGIWQWLTGLAGLVLLIDLWLPWFGALNLTANAWESFAFIDLILALAGLGAIGLVVVTARQSAAVIPKKWAKWLMWLAIVGALFALYRLLNPPDADIVLTGGGNDVTRKAGVWIGLIVAAALAALARQAWRDPRFPGPLRQHPDSEPLAPAAPEEPHRTPR